LSFTRKLNKSWNTSPTSLKKNMYGPFLLAGTLVAVFQFYCNVFE
jgi:hypothetical protein